MRNLKITIRRHKAFMPFLIVLLPFLMACSNHPKEDSVECTVEIDYQGQTYKAREADDSVREARNDAIEEACERACNDADDCERDCVKKAEVKSVNCINRYTGEDIQTLI